MRGGSPFGGMGGGQGFEDMLGQMFGGGMGGGVGAREQACARIRKSARGRRAGQQAKLSPNLTEKQEKRKKLVDRTAALRTRFKNKKNM